MAFSGDIRLKAGEGGMEKEWRMVSKYQWESRSHLQAQWFKGCERHLRGRQHSEGKAQFQSNKVKGTSRKRWRYQRFGWWLANEHSARSWRGGMNREPKKGLYGVFWEWQPRGRGSPGLLHTDQRKLGRSAWRLVPTLLGRQDGEAVRGSLQHSETHPDSSQDRGDPTQRSRFPVRVSRGLVVPWVCTSHLSPAKAYSLACPLHHMGLCQWFWTFCVCHLSRYHNSVMAHCNSPHI